MTRPQSVVDIFRSLMLQPDVIRIEAHDGSVAGPVDAPARIVVKDERALQYLLSAPSDLGLARAYVSGALDVQGDLHLVLVTVAQSRDGRRLWQDVAALVPAAPQLLPLLKSRPAPPPAEAPSRWRRGLRHSMSRDAEAISHHYDVSNRFYKYVLGPSMTYTCAVYPSAEATLEEAQAAKYDLVCHKLGLQPGMQLLDVGCGWGGMVMHASEHYGVNALGVTLSRQQAEWAGKAIAERGLTQHAEVRHLDYRSVPDDAYDAISSIGLTEHIGRRNLSAYFESLHAKLRPQGRLLNHCITRSSPGLPARAGPFIDRYVFPDGELESPGLLVQTMNAAGFEIRHVENLREHYALTLRDWGANLERHWDAAVAEVGEAKARVWRLYMAGSRSGFDTNAIQLHQILGVRPEHTPSGVRSGFPLRPTY